MFSPYQWQIVQGLDQVVILYEYPGAFRVIPTHGGAHQPELDPTWYGDSIGHWEGDTPERNLGSTRNEFQLEAAARDRQFGYLLKGEDRNRQKMESALNQRAIRRIAFEIGRNHTNEIAPGIWLRITRANQDFSNVEGWMRVMPKDRTFWFHRQDAQEPFVFYGREHDRKRELVVTRVRSNSVTGYLILPAAETPAKQVAARRTTAHSLRKLKPGRSRTGVFTVWFINCE